MNKLKKPKTPSFQRKAVKNYKQRNIIRKNIDFNLRNDIDVAILDAFEKDERTIICILRQALVNEFGLDMTVPKVLKNPPKET